MVQLGELGLPLKGDISTLCSRRRLLLSGLRIRIRVFWSGPCFKKIVSGFSIYFFFIKYILTIFQFFSSIIWLKYREKTLRNNLIGSDLESFFFFFFFPRIGPELFPDACLGFNKWAYPALSRRWRRSILHPPGRSPTSSEKKMSTLFSLLIL